jgi:hypothetical protein
MSWWNSGNVSNFQPHAELGLPPGRARQDSGDLAEIRPSSQPIRVGKFGMVQQIIKIAAEL